MAAATWYGFCDWNGALLPQQTATWTGECAREHAQGQGTLKWVWDRGRRGKESATETGHLRAGQWIRRYGNGSVHEGEVVEGKQHGRWVTRHKSGKREVATCNHGWQGKWTTTPDEDPKEIEVNENMPRHADGDR